MRHWAFTKTGGTREDGGAKHAALGPSHRRAGREKTAAQNMRQWAFPRGPPPQYYPISTELNFAVRMGSGDPR